MSLEIVEYHINVTISHKFVRLVSLKVPSGNAVEYTAIPDPMSPSNGDVSVTFTAVELSLEWWQFVLEIRSISARCESGGFEHLPLERPVIQTGVEGCCRKRCGRKVVEIWSECRKGRPRAEGEQPPTPPPGEFRRRGREGGQGEGEQNLPSSSPLTSSTYHVGNTSSSSTLLVEKSKISMFVVT